MAGYGNRTAPTYTTTTSPSHLSTQHAETHLAPSPSAPTYGAGYGNKRASLTPTTSAEETESDRATENDGVEKGGIEKGEGEEPLRFDSQTTHGSAPYTGAHTYGSASTAGAGWGNKTGGFAGEGEESSLGRVMHKLGEIVHSPALTKKGREERGDADVNDGRDARAPVAN